MALPAARGTRPIPQWLPGLGLLLAVLPGFSACSRNETAPAVGTIERHRFEIAAPANEEIAALEVREGQGVHQGEVLARFDERSLREGRATLQAQMGQMRERLAELTHGPRSQEITAARAQLAGVQAERERAGREYLRGAEILKQGLISQSAVDLLRQQRDSAEAAVHSADAGLQLLLQGTRSEQLDQARSALAAAEAQLRQQDVALTKLVLTAPIDGVVEAIPFRQGERPPVGAPVIILLASGAPFARVYVPEGSRASLRPGQSLPVKVDGLAQPLTGKLRYLAGEASFTPYYSLTQRDRSRLAYVAEVDLDESAARDLPVGVPVEVSLGAAP
jgi:HlyD family secretion protein